MTKPVAVFINAVITNAVGKVISSANFELDIDPSQRDNYCDISSNRYFW